MKRLLIFLLLICILIVLCSCSKSISYDAYEELIENLNNKGYTIEIEDVEKSILLGQRKWLTVNEGSNISVYLYENNHKMEKDASFLSKDGLSYDNGKKKVLIEWVSYPHFFKYGNMIVLYVGEDKDIIQTLEECLGPQYAGYKD